MKDIEILSTRRLTERQIAIVALLQQPDPDDLHCGHVSVCEGEPDRFARWRDLPIRFVNLTRQEREP